LIEILFFARLREQVGTARLEYSPAQTPTTVGSLLAELRARGEAWDAALGADNILCAVNQRQADTAQTIAPGDEVAFFPPVTGG
jgi:molybdopterin synthase sulfur carrier subunit